MGQVVWTEPALADLRRILKYIATDAPKSAAKLGTRLVRASRRLARLPRSGIRVPEFEEDPIREILVGAYRVIYVIQGETCNVAAIVHASRDLANLLRLEEWESS